MIFWDASAFVRAFLAEDPGYGHARSLFFKEPRHSGSTLLWPETAGALLRRARARWANRSFDTAEVELVLARFELVDLTPDVSERAVELVMRSRLSGPDAAHLASALKLARTSGTRGFRFACSDRELAAAARASGLRVVSPGL